MLAPPPLPRTLAASLRDLGSDKPQTRASAIRDLVRHASSSDETRAAAIPLFEKALRDEAPIVRSGAAVALADLRAHEALPGLLIAVEDADPHVRQMALSALGEIGDPRARTRIERALADERPEVRYQAVIAFARVASEPADVETAIARAMGDADDAIRYIALRLAEDHHLEKSANVARRARELLEDTHGSVALAAAILLARGGDEKAKRVIAKVIRDGGGSAERIDEQAAVELAGELAMRETIPDLEKRAWGVLHYMRDTCAWHAKIALAKMGHAKAKKDILGDLDSWRREARQAAVVAAGRAKIVEARARIEVLGGDVDAALATEALRQIDAAVFDVAIAAEKSRSE